MVKLVTISSVSVDSIERLLDDAFGADRLHRTAYLLRNGMPVIDHLSFGALDGGSAIGSIQCWPVAVGDAPLILVGPVAVAPERQGQGIGRRLMNATLDSALSGDAPMVMIGDPEYYGRFGFDAVGTSGWTLPGPWEPRRLLLRNPDNVSLPVTGMLGSRTRL